VEIKVEVKVLKGIQKKIAYERKIWTIKYMRPSDLAQNFIEELDKIVQQLKNKK